MNKKIVITLLLLNWMLHPGNTTAKASSYINYNTDSIISVKQFGAVGDGVTDDWAAITKAIIQTNDTQTIYFPAGKYFISKTLVVNNPTKMTADRATITGNTTVFLTQRAKGSSITKLSFNGVNISVRCGNVSISGNSFSQIKNNAIDVIVDSSSTIDNVNVANNKFDNIYPFADKLYNSSGRALRVTAKGKCTNLTFAGNSCTQMYGGSAVFLSGTFSRFSIDSNIINNISGQGVELFQIDENSSGEISGNTISNCGILRTIKSGVGCNGIYASTPVASVPMKYISVVNNNISNVYENGIEGNFNLIQGNIITNTGSDLVNHPTPSPEGIFGGMNIIKNTITNPGGHGINIFSNNGALIADRVITDNIIIQNKRKPGFSGISINTRVATQLTQNITIKNNKITNFETSIYLPYGKRVRGVAVQNNTAEKCGSFIKNDVSGLLINSNSVKDGL